MRVDARGTVLCLAHPVEVEEDSLDVLLVLEEEAALDGLADLVHFLQAHLLLLLVQTVFV